ncbi:MAG: META domain-containing protein [Edaphocola sp.]
MRHLISLSLLLVLFSCSALKKKTKTAAGSVKGTSWELASIPGFALEKTKRPVTLNFGDTTNRAGGFTGCNTYGGNVEIKGTALKFGDILATQKACMPGSKTERRVLDILRKTDHYKLSGGNLILLQGTGELAVFRAAKK